MHGAAGRGADQRSGASFYLAELEARAGRAWSGARARQDPPGQNAVSADLLQNRNYRGCRGVIRAESRFSLGDLHVRRELTFSKPTFLRAMMA